MSNAKKRADIRVPPRLLQHSLSRVSQNDRKFSLRRGSCHVARVLIVAGRIRKDKSSAWGAEISIRNINCDPLLALGTQAIGQICQLEPVRTAHTFELIVISCIGIVEQTPYKR